jgi:predicted peptidase
MTADSNKTIFLPKSIEVDGQEFKYAIYVPPTYDPKTPQPTIIFLNGHGECGTDGMLQTTQGIGNAVKANPEKWPFLIIFPQKQVGDEKWEDEESMVLAILGRTREEYNIDDSRLYLTGISQGGHGTWAIGSRHPELFAAIAPICGWGDEKIAAGLVNMPIRAFHGDIDSAVPVQESLDMENRLKAAGGSCDLTIYPGIDHNSWDKAYGEENLGEWFLQHKK